MASEDGRTPQDEREKLRIMGHWLDVVAAELDVDRDLLERVSGPVLGLTSDIAHGPSRPGAPLTMLAIGLAATDRTSEEVTEMVVRWLATGTRDGD